MASRRLFTTRKVEEMNVLFLSHVRDSTASNGGMVYTNQVLSQLRSICSKVDVIYIYDQPPKFRKLRICTAMMRSMFASLPAKVLYFDRQSIRRALSQYTATIPPDMVIFDHLETVIYLRDFPGKPTPVLIQHNDEAKLYEQRLEKMRGLLTGALFRSEGAKLRRFQERVSLKIRNKVFISSDELDNDTALKAEGNRIGLLPAFEYKIENSNRRQNVGDVINVAFIGNMKWWPNRDAVEWLLEEVTPHLNGNIAIHLIGMDSDAKRYQRENVIGHGFVNKTADTWNKADIFLSPIVSGAGLNLKVAEAIYNGKSIITTSRGIRGIPLENDPSIVITDDADGWISVLNDHALMSRLSSAPPLTQNSNLFDRKTSVAKLKSFLEMCK
jgi:hypothetical protein